jgi:multidrug efflux pump
MAALGFTLNSLTLFGLVLAIGIVVDDAIVVLENIERQMARGLDVRTATLKAMEEITGPVLAITLVLSAVFVPCCFLGGVSGHFFRQFAVTVAASMMISAVNALTMTPSRAVLIFKTQEKDGVHEHQREALPWWIFGVLGGALAAWLGPRLFQISDFRFQIEMAMPSGFSQSAISNLQSAIYFLPGALAGGVLGWIVIRPVNAVLGWVFRGFNRLFDRATGLYGKSVSGVLRLSVLALALYGGLLILTGWQFARAPTGFVPQQDKGYLILNVQLPDAAAVDRTQRILDRIERVALSTPGVEHTLGVAGRSLILNANAPNLASLYVILKDFGSGAEQGSVRTPSQSSCKSVARRRSAADSSRPSADRRSKGSARRAVSSSSSRTGGTSGWASCSESPINS